MTKLSFTQDFDWGLYPGVERLLHREMRRFLSRSPYTRKLAQHMWNKTSTHIIDWIDHLIIPASRVSETYLLAQGFEELDVETPKGMKAYKHPRTIFFPVLLSVSDKTEMALKPEYVEPFLKALKKKSKVEGHKLSAFRRAIIHEKNNYVLSAIERKGTRGFTVPKEDDIQPYKKALDLFKNRKRNFRVDKDGMRYTKNLVKKILTTLSPERTADAFFRNERIYWQARNKAGQTQKKRQDLLGLGWGNHDHHTYRCSRSQFKGLIQIFELIGMECRERFFAGEQAGWGAQVLEHPACDIVVFADVDVTNKERNKDFAHKGLSNRKSLGTVGLWTGLHGESVLQAGMHHLEARFDFYKLRHDLQQHGVGTLPPFSEFAFLKQAFTEGQRWNVDPKRARALLRKGSITKEECARFIKEGAIGSHLENLQRTQGFKGFNQKSVTAIIHVTDPRKKRDIGA